MSHNSALPLVSDIEGSCQVNGDLTQKSNNRRETQRKTVVSGENAVQEGKARPDDDAMFFGGPEDEGYDERPKSRGRQKVAAANSDSRGSVG